MSRGWANNVPPAIHAAALSCLQGFDGRPTHWHELGVALGERVLFKTRNSARDWANEPFDESFVHISPAAAQFLADRQVMTVGVDYLSIGGFKAGGVECHQIMLGAGIWVIEGLQLAGVGAGVYEMLCLPIKLHGAEGAPARVLIWEM